MFSLIHFFVALSCNSESSEHKPFSFVEHCNRLRARDQNLVSKEFRGFHHDKSPPRLSFESKDVRVYNSQAEKLILHFTAQSEESYLSVLMHESGEIGAWHSQREDSARKLVQEQLCIDPELCHIWVLVSGVGELRNNKTTNKLRGVNLQPLRCRPEAAQEGL